ncbi:MAG TPA: glucose-1-phosphate adenylyltransferase [Candidatus Hydrogenedentes bacterium]|nr:glucose-1-phosphate adenylyltransferase [Candidatus Hydrogenedentota bacterium]
MKRGSGNKAGGGQSAKKQVDLVIGHDVMEQVGAIVLGGGRGTRLYPLTALRAKPAVPLLGRYRLVDVPLSLCIHSGIKRIMVLTQFNSASLHRHIGNSYQFDHFSRGFVEILAAEQTMESGDWYQGTADAVRKQLRHIRDLDASHYLILSGDHLYSMDYRTLMRTHLENDADITVATVPVGAQAARGFGIMKVYNTGRIREFVEKPATAAQLEPLATPPALFDRFGLKTDHRYLASMGIYLIRAGVLETILRERPDWIDFGKHVIPYSLRERRVFAHPFDGFWEDIGTVRSYYEVHMRMVSPNVPFRMFDQDRLFYTHPRLLPGSRFQDARIRDSIVCEGCRIRNASIQRSVIGIRSLVNDRVSIDRSVIMGADYLEVRNPDAAVPMGIGEGSIISCAIVDKNARIGKNVVIRGSKRLADCDGDGYAVRDGIVVVMKNAVIPDGTHVE